MRRKISFAFQALIVALLGLLAARNIISNAAIAQNGKGPESVLTQVNNARSVYLSLPDAGISAVKERANTSLGAQNGLEVVREAETLYTALETPQIGTRLFVTADDLTKIDDKWFQEKYAQGVAIIGIGVPLSELAAKAGVTPTIADLDMAYVGGRTQVSMIQRHTEDKTEGYGFTTFYTDFWTNLTDLPATLKGYALERK